MLLSSIDSAISNENSLLESIRPLQQKLAAHPLYRSIQTLPAVHCFMGSHVFAVWDFMSLLKSLQRSLTCVSVPWLPSEDRLSRRFINEIVLGEESDTYEGESLSHFELYLHAMQSCGAKTGPILRLISSLRAEENLEQALSTAPTEAATFVRATFRLIDSGSLPRIAGAFTFGREDLIPDMFRAFIQELDAQFPGQIAPFRYYLERHIEVDGEDHGPMALALMRHVCTAPSQWQDATDAAIAALEARIALWDGIHARIQQSAD